MHNIAESRLQGLLVIVCLLSCEKYRVFFCNLNSLAGGRHWLRFPPENSGQNRDRQMGENRRQRIAANGSKADKGGRLALR